MSSKKLAMKAALLLFTLYLIVYAVDGDSDTKLDDNWFKTLPTCPCFNPDRNQIILADGWAKDKGNLSTYHKGAAECFRSYPYLKTAAGNSCQQCCYNKAGELIKAGPGAGTPDKVSTCAGEDDSGNMKIRFFSLMNHYFKDVQPWKKAGTPENAWKIYNQYWVPNQGNCDSLNVKK